MRGLVRGLLASGVLALALAIPAWADHNADQHSPNMELLFNSPNDTGAINSDLAFWRDRAYQGDYDGFRIFDISDPANPDQLVDFPCFGPQNDPIVWRNRLLFMAVDSVLTGPECGSETSPTPDEGWEGVRIFDVSDPENPELIKGVFTDCGAHTITLYPKKARHKAQGRGRSQANRQLMIYVSSYPLRPGPTCGPENGPKAGNSPLHEKISVIRVPTKKPQKARVVAQPKISYPGDPDNQFDPTEHGIDPGVFNPLTACHDIGVFVELRLAAGACAEQGQLWRVRKNGIPRTKNPLWVFDDNTDETGTTGDPGDSGVAADFWHSATFSWDGKIVNFIDESFGIGCPPVTDGVGDTGRMFFLRTKNGNKLSQFMLPRTESALDGEGAETAYCSAHLGVPVASTNRRLLVNAWYMGGVDVIDFTRPRAPEERAFYDIAPAGPTGSDNWSAYWYEGPARRGKTIYGTDGVHNPATGRGFEVFSARVRGKEKKLRRLNPQTQERVIELRRRRGSAGAASRGQRASGGSAPAQGRVDPAAVARRLAP